MNEHPAKLITQQCANRLYVHEAVVDEFCDKLVERVKAMKVGNGLDDGTTQGPLVNAAAVKKVEQHVNDAVAKGGVLLVGGKALDGKGFFYEPTVIRNASKDMEVAVDETFGPLAPVFAFSTEAEVLELANATEFGLSGYFFSRSIGRVMRVARALECGMVGVNTGFISACEAPFTGVKESGVGIESSKYGMAEYQNVKAVTIGNLDD